MPSPSSAWRRVPLQWVQDAEHRVTHVPRHEGSTQHRDTHCGAIRAMQTYRCLYCTMCIRVAWLGCRHTVRAQNTLINASGWKNQETAPNNNRTRASIQWMASSKWRPAWSLHACISWVLRLCLIWSGRTARMPSQRVRLLRWATIAMLLPMRGTSGGGEGGRDVLHVVRSVRESAARLTMRAKRVMPNTQQRPTVAPTSSMS